MLKIKQSRFLLVVALICALVAGFAKPSNAFLDKTRFVAHLGVAYFCFHHWVVKPYEGGEFANGAAHRTSSIVKGGAALLFAYHEVRVAQKIAHNSKSPLLHALDNKLIGLGASFVAVGESLKAGHFSMNDINGLKTQAEAFKTQAASAGEVIKDVPVPDLKPSSVPKES
jgi:hypothetical protein